MLAVVERATPFRSILDGSCNSSTGGAMYCVNTRQTLLRDLTDAEVDRWSPMLQCQPAQIWDSTVKYCGWREVPCVYLVCEGDRLLPTGVQRHMAETTGAKVERCTAGHSHVYADCSREGSGNPSRMLLSALESMWH